MMSRTAPAETLKRARKEETSNIVILAITIMITLAALADVGNSLSSIKRISNGLRVFDIAECLIGILLAWLLLHIMYSLHYAKLYYSPINDTDTTAFKKGLAFPGNEDVVDYWDFVYYAFTIGMCYQTSDITVTSPYMRRLTIFHAIISYVFALAILGLLVDAFIGKL
jgi:uncharacterized membrane protein